jgi:putative ABC transport system permease protein
MRIGRIVKSGFRVALAHKLRATLMVLGITIGIASLTLVISLGRGTEERLMSRVRTLIGSNTIMIVAGKPRLESNQRVTGSLATLSVEDIAEIGREVAEVVVWDAVQISPGREVSYTGKRSIATISGHMPSGQRVWNISVTDGRFFTDGENRNLSRVALLAPNVARELFGSSSPIGEQILVGNVPLEVIGVIGPRGMDPHGIDKDSEILVPLNTVLRRIVNLDYVTMGKLLVADEKLIPQTADEVSRLLRQRHGSGAGDDFMIVTPTMANAMVKQAARIFTVYLPLVAGVSLLVGCLVIANLMLIAVNERRSEIGLRKAVGAKSRDILSQFLIESTTITAGSGVLGIAIGLIAFSLISPRMDVPFSISWGVLTVCFFTSLLAGVLSGFLPARKAARLQPVEALS